MVAGIPLWTRASGLAIWVAIKVSDDSSGIQDVEHGGGDAVGCLPAIFAHPDERVPVARPQERKKGKPGEIELAGVLAVLGDELIEVWQIVGEAVTHTFDAVEGDLTHKGEAGNGGGFHIDEGGVVSGGEAAFFLLVGDDGAGDEPDVV